MKLHWPLMGGWADTFCTVRRQWAGPAQAPPRCAKYINSTLNGQCLMCP